MDVVTRYMTIDGLLYTDVKAAEAHEAEVTKAVSEAYATYKKLPGNVPFVTYLEAITQKLRETAYAEEYRQEQLNRMPQAYGGRS